MNPMGADGVRVGRNGRTILIPGWLIAATGIMGSIFAAGWVASRQVQELVDAQQWMNYRLCRVEARMNGAELWPTCQAFRFRQPAPPPSQGGN